MTFDGLEKRGYFTVFHKGRGEIRQGQTYDITFDLDGQVFDAVVHGFRAGRVPEAGMFFRDRDFDHAIAAKRMLTVYGQTGARVMAINLTGSAKALE